MKLDFQQLMREATRLTQAGDLSGSMAAIQAALSGSAPTRPPDDKVIDVASRWVDEEPRAREEALSSFSAGSFRNTAGARDYKLFIPPRLPDQPRALIVMLHGCTQNPDDFAVGTRMNALAAAHNALVLYPAQDQAANPQGCWSWFKHSHQTRERGEPSILAELTREIIASHGVDATRVFIAGLSAGGAMAAIMGAAYPELFAAVGVHSGLAAGAAKDLPSALAAMKRAPAQSLASTLPTIVFHGDVDATVDCSNGAQVAAAHSQPAAVEMQQVRQGGRDCTRALHRRPDGRVIAEHWLVHGAGHAWSGGAPAGSYTDGRGPDASREMLRFFFEQGLPAR